MNDIDQSPRAPVAPSAIAAPSALATRVAPYAAALVVAAFVGVLVLQLGAGTAAALAAAAAAALWGGIGWPLWVRAGGVTSPGRAAAFGVVAVAAGAVGAGLASGGLARLAEGGDAVVTLLFAVGMVTPMVIAAAVGLAVLTRRFDPPR
ncbi:hypothetical protein EYW49_17845 [Siculibacillus lacustris]|uniref:Uncharacterized protein n=1 Tax=Siculibacillus lacustris TaxID=1549641 RepID=A0A4Q9VHJ5_9HYPH|nr:hypothetical protein [Siculibacillus lacustris]TBW34609.1 hypothetical protein EYW49_17845 [Siculibacillus lacustris]